jgi:SAM-dependent methyltransferase
VSSEIRPEPFPPQGADLRRPSVARVYDYYLGGKDNWAIDREFGERVLEKAPMCRDVARSNRQFLFRVVRHLMRLGVRQFIDVGAGLPTMRPTHEVADEVEPGGSRVVYVDYEPVAVAESQVLLAERGDPRRHAAVNGDLRAPRRLWEQIADLGVIDFDRPVALLIIAVLHVHQPDEHGQDIGARVVAEYRDLLRSGSYLAISHTTADGVPASRREQLLALKRLYDQGSSPLTLRSRREIRDLFGDFDLVEPGLAWVPSWHPEYDDPLAAPISFATPMDSVLYAGLGRKP